MKKPQRIVPTHPKTLPEQKSDFTAEGAPPPGKVVGSVPPMTVEEVPVAKPQQPHANTAETLPTGP